MSSSTKICSGCKKTLVISEFYKDSQKKEGLSSRCKSCIKPVLKKWRDNNQNSRAEYNKRWHRDNREHVLAKQKRWYQDNKERFAAIQAKARLKRKYGLLPAQYNQMHQNQKGLCKICHLPNRPSTRKLSVDHNHDSRAVRGLLCSNCNLGLGHFKDSPQLLKQAALYLEGAYGVPE